MPDEMSEEQLDAHVAEGGLVSDSRSSDYDRTWITLIEAMEQGTNLSAMIIDASRGGLEVDLGVRGFIPKSQLATRDLNNLERFIGETVEVKVVEVDRDKGRVILSQRKASDETRSAQREETMAKLAVGQSVEGVVRRLTDFGAFVDIGGIDGLLHISDLSWDNVEKASDVVSEGDTLTVKVLKVERGGERISLGLKQLGDDPWTTARKEFREGDIVEAEVLRIMPFGAIARIAKGVEGVIPNREINDRHGDAPEIKLVPGQKLDVKITEFLAGRDRRLSMSVRQVAREREKQVMRDYQQRTREEISTPTLGDLFGDVFSKLKKDE
jgi:small subunit ribosomal protein S1